MTEQIKEYEGVLVTSIIGDSQTGCIHITCDSLPKSPAGFHAIDAQAVDRPYQPRQGDYKY